MHDVFADENSIDQRVAESPELLGQECAGCRRVLEWSFFRRDHSFRNGRVALCVSCEAVPRLSLAEHTARLREKNLSSEAVKKQKAPFQQDYKFDAARIGRRMSHGEFLAIVKKLAPSLFVMEGNIEGDLALYRTFGCPQAELNGNDFQYLGYCPTGILNEYSIHEFDGRDVLIREKSRGWRTVLLRLILNGLITETQAEEVFGPAVGPASAVYNRRLQNFRNKISN